MGGRFWELSFGKRPAQELYRISRDPACLINLAADPIYSDTVNEMQTRMLAMLREEGDQRSLGHADIFDSYQYLGRRDKGYETWMGKQNL